MIKAGVFDILKVGTKSYRRRALSYTAPTVWNKRSITGIRNAPIWDEETYAL